MQEDVQQENLTPTKYHIDLPFLKDSRADTLKPRIVYGFDPIYKAEYGWSGYYLEIKSMETGKVVMKRGFNEDLEGGEMLILLEKIIPDTAKRTSQLDLLDEHKGLIAAGLPI